MKTLFYTLLFVLAINLVKAQSTALTATMQDETNELLHYTVIEDNKYGNVALSDSVGNCTIQVHP